MSNYFNKLTLREQLTQLGKCRLMDIEEFSGGISALKGKQIIVVGCGAQGLNQGLNMRDSGLNVAFALRDSAIKQRRVSYLNATEHQFEVGTFQEMIPKADVVCNLTPDKQHTPVVQSLMPLMKKGSTLSYSHGFNIVEEGLEIRKDITVIMVAPKCPGTEVREEYLKGFGVPTLIAVHGENDPSGEGFEQAKAYAYATGGHRAGVLESSFIAEVKSDLMGEQTILCGVLQTGSILCFDKMVEKNINPSFAAKLVQHGWETITEALKHGGITNMMDRLSNPAKIKAFQLADQLKEILTPLFRHHMDNIMSGEFSKNMMKDWVNNDRKLFQWRSATAKTQFEKTVNISQKIEEQAYFDRGVLMVAFIKAGVELAFDTMVTSGIKEESAYYESLHETPLIANLISRKKLYEMNRVISDTAEYGCYLFDHAAKPLLEDFMKTQDKDVIGDVYSRDSNQVDNKTLIDVNEKIRYTLIEDIGGELRDSMTNMPSLVSASNSS